ncbi:hypothetical protein NONI108955_22910 [Nocardia ninae]|uniref:Uncharacterized protein n=2 Tax=Nocardia TaxID=1817 RepID=A0A511MT95_9NOCA|nr:hypothetical protein NN4_81800 [Nocardia ninae NBRC 108245]
MPEAMTTEPGTNRPDDTEVDRDEVDQPDVTDDAAATREDQAANMDYEGDTPN